MWKSKTMYLQSPVEQRTKLRMKRWTSQASLTRTLASQSLFLTGITAKAEDGMLRIDLPAKVVEEKKDNVLKIEVK